MLCGGILLLLLLLEYIFVGIYYKKHFYNNTFINGVDCSNLTAKEAAKRLQKEASLYVLTIRGLDGVTQQITGESIGLSSECDGDIKQLLKEQGGFLWLVNAFKTHNLKKASAIRFDAEKLQQKVDALAFFHAKNIVSPKNAYISPYKQGKEFTIVKEIVGNELDKEKVNEVIKEAVETLAVSISLKEKNCYKQPSILSDDPKLTKALKEMNQYRKTSLTYEFGEKTEILDERWIGPALIVDAKGEVKIDESYIKQFVSYLADTYNIKNKTVRFMTSYGYEVNLWGGKYGFIIDEEKELKEILDCIKKGSNMKKKPVTSADSENKEYQTLGKTYVEISKKKQHLFYYVNGKLVVESDVVTGIPKNGHDTPIGIYYVSQIQRNRTLRGYNDDGSKYEVDVQYWMRFNGGIGLHDAPWQPYFGGRRYLYAGSHGCVNLPTNVARTIFANIQLNTPVIVY